MTQSPLLAIAFRPFFLLAALWAFAAMGLWLLALTGAAWAPSLTPAWHAHELLFGVVAAAAAGFALTAVATWTGTPPVAGMPLLALILLWLAGRATMLLTFLPDAVVATVNILFLPALAAALLARLVPAGNRRNYPLALILLVFAVAQAGWHFVSIDTRVAYDAGMLTVAALISLIAGRITPAFTRNWLRSQSRRENVRDPAVLESANVGALLLAATAVLAEQQTAGAILALGGAIAATLRVLGWNGHRVLGVPLLWILHLAWLWLILALILMGLAGLGVAVPVTLWWHALGAGAIGTILIGVMTRVSLGHTGRALELPRGAVGLSLLISVAALARIGAAMLPGAFWMPLLTVAAGAWMLAWLGYLVLFGPILLTPRQDGRPG